VVSRIYQFGPYRLDVAQQLLLRNGSTVALTPKAMEILKVLLEQAGHVVSKEELLHRVWTDTFVDEGNLTQTVFVLRKALGYGLCAQYIETVPRRGYRFIGEVQTVDELDRSYAPPASAGGSARRLKLMAAAVVLAIMGAALFYFSHRPRHDENVVPVHSIAVLPFVTVGGEARDQTLELGIADSLITQLAQMRIPVRPLASVAAFNAPERNPLSAGRNMRVDAVLDGSVERNKDRLRISARLFRVRDGQALWIGRFDEPANNILLVQDRISEEVARTLDSDRPPARVHLAHAQTTNFNAYREYIEGRYLWNTREPHALLRAIAHFESAIHQDPGYAAAYAGLADAYALLACGLNLGISRPEGMRRAKAAALTAMKLDDSLAESHTSLAFELMHYEWKWTEAEKEFRRAVELDPNYATAHQWYAYDLLALNRVDEALAEARRAQELDPTSVIINSDVAEFLFFAGKLDVAEQQARTVLEMNPNFRNAHLDLAVIFMQEQRYAEALKETQLARRSDAGDAYCMGVLAAAYAVAGDRKQAQRLVDQMLARRNSPEEYLQLATAYAAMGDVDRSAIWLGRSYRQHSDWPLLVSPEWKGVRENPKIVSLEQRYGVPILSRVP
jgi:DNA-binding winged helix-turn-helix (wHTH) protein/TolB-like protein/Flp pilus assembly protein TadD